MAQLPINISRDDWWRDLEMLTLPRPLLLLLRSLVNAQLNSTIPPRALESDIALAKEHLSGGIWIGNLDYYHVMVFVPKDLGIYHKVFMLVPSYPTGNMRRLEEM